MSITREVTVWCDECSHWEQKSGGTATSFRKDLRKSGWFCTKGKDLCPKCFRKATEEKEK